MKKLRRAAKEYKRYQMSKTITKLTIERDLLLNSVIY